MTLTSTQFIGSARCPELNSNPSVSSNGNAFTSYFCMHSEPMTFDLMTQESTQFIGSARYIHDLSLAGIHQSVLMIMRSQAIFAYIMSRMTFDLDLMTPKYNQFISSASNIHDLSLAGIHQSVLEITRSRERDVRTDVRTDGRTDGRTDNQKT